MLRSSIPSERLESARYFSENATQSELAQLKLALSQEKVTWIENAIKRAIFRIEPELPDLGARQADNLTGETTESLPEELFAEALEATTKQVLHEIEPLIGALRLTAETEIDNFELSETFQKLERIGLFMTALSRLREAASSPELKEFHLDGVISDCILAVREDFIVTAGDVLPCKISDAGKRPCIAYGDPGLLSLAIRNGIKNAVEATASLDVEKKPDVLVSWGETEKSYWVSIVDHGVGFSGNTLRAFEMGKTSKVDHLGMGLTISKRAIDSLGGTITLTPRERGVRFEISWVKRL